MCEISFNLMKGLLQKAHLVWYPNSQAKYTLYTDASKYLYAGVLKQNKAPTIQ